MGSEQFIGCPQKLLYEPWIIDAVRLWSRWKKFGWPYEGGWAEQPARVFDVIEAVENESIYLDNERIERAKNGNGN